MVFQVRIHGRGGQGVVTAAELLSVAAFAEGRHAQAFPSFGFERTGARVVAFCRISEAAIRVREPVMNPNAVIIQDTTLLHHVDVFSGLVDGGYVLVNSAHPFESLGIGDLTGGMTASRIVTVPATELALEHLGRPVPTGARRPSTRPYRGSTRRPRCTRPGAACPTATASTATTASACARTPR